MIRYIFTVKDLHPLLLAGFAGALRSVVQMIRVQCFSAVEVCRNMTLGLAVKRRWLAQFDTDQLVQPTVVAPTQSRAFACGQPDPRYAALRRTTLNI